MCNGVAEQKLDLDLRTNLAIFEKQKFAESLWHGSLVLYMPKPDKNDA